MYWSQWYRLRGYVQSSLWIVPFISLLVYAVAIRLIFAIEGWTVWRPFLSSWGWRPLGTQNVLETIVTMMLTFIVFTFGSLLVAVQIAGGQMTPRIMAATLLRDNAIRFSVGLFTFTLLVAIGALARLETTVPPFVAFVAGLLGICSLAAFLFLIDYAARLLTPVRILTRVGDEGRTVIESVYGDRSSGADPSDEPHRKLPTPDRIVEYRGKSATLLAVNLEVLVATAQEANCVIELVPRVGDFVATGDALFQVYGNAASLGEHRLSGLVAFGPERTMEQDCHLCISDYRRHRHKGAVEGDKRSDDRRPRPRSASTPAKHGRPASSLV